jgi:hypothetical protein
MPKGLPFLDISSDNASKDLHVLRPRKPNTANLEEDIIRQIAIFIGHPSKLGEVGLESHRAKKDNGFIKHFLGLTQAKSNKIHIIKEGKTSDPNILDIMFKFLEQEGMLLPPGIKRHISPTPLAKMHSPALGTPRSVKLSQKMSNNQGENKRGLRATLSKPFSDTEATQTSTTVVHGKHLGRQDFPKKGVYQSNGDGVMIHDPNNSS